MHICEKYVKKVEVIRVDKINIDSIQIYDKLIFSPGPGLPSDYPVLFQILQKLPFEYLASLLFDSELIYYGYY